MKLYIRVLKFGDSGEDVTALQNRLIELGFGRCLFQGKVKELTAEGDFYEITRECLESFQTKVQDAVLIAGDFVPEEVKEKYPFSIDGVMNFADWYILENYEKLSAWYKLQIVPPEIATPIKLVYDDFISQVINLAKNEIGTVEDKPYNNSGKRVNEYQKIGSCNQINTGSPWCQYFMNFLLKQLNHAYMWTCSGYTPDNVNFAVKKGCGVKNAKVKDMKVGDFGFIYSPSRGNARHVFLIIAVNQDTVTTIEGNTNNDGGADGFGVFKRVRPVSQVWAVARWADLYK